MGIKLKVSPRSEKKSKCDEDEDEYREIWLEGDIDDNVGIYYSPLLIKYFIILYQLNNSVT